MSKKIAIFVNHPQCSIQSVNGVMEALPEYSFKIFTKHHVEKSFFDDVHMVCFPGGIGDSDSFDDLLRKNKDEIKKIVQQGRPYLGICMGAYWCDSFYFDFLKGTRVVQYIKARGTCTKRPHAKAIPITWKGRQDRMFFYDGCTFEGGDYVTVATYAETGYTMAMTQENLGLIGCHPEATQHWFDSYNYMKEHWHHGMHHKLLNQFVKKLL